MPRITDYTWYVYGHIPATFGGQPSDAVFTNVWRNSFVQAGFDPAEADNCFSTKCSADGNDPATHIYFATPLAQNQFWYIGEAMADQFGLQFPVQPGDTPDEISVNPDVAAFLGVLASQGLIVHILRNDLGQNRVNVDEYLAGYDLQRIVPKEEP